MKTYSVILYIKSGTPAAIPCTWIVAAVPLPAAGLQGRVGVAGVVARVAGIVQARVTVTIIIISIVITSSITLPVPDKVREERLRPVPGAVPLVTRRPVVVSLQLGSLVTNTHLAINIFTTLKYF